MPLSKSFDTEKRESTIYSTWEKKGVFKPDLNQKGEPFTIIMPPPNANGSLHAGHAVGYTLEDIIIRYMRMQGRPALWQPGTDHAGIETQFVYEKKLAEKRLDRFDLGPKKFYQEVMEFTRAQEKNVLAQFRSIGFSADWDRLKFTLDEDVINTVYDTFISMHEDGHIYRGNRIVNWCPRCGAAFADIEVERTDTDDPFYTLQYGPFEIGTARPETKFGDKYVVMHPDDTRYADYSHGDTFEAEWIDGPVTATVIKDESIDMEFGTGVMTITPWHDATDFDIAKRFDLDMQQVIDEQGELLPLAKEFSGMGIEEARPKIVAKLEAKGLLVKTEVRTHAVATHDRCGTKVEPQISKQWFVRMAELNKPVIKAIQSEEIKFFPKRFKKVALNWLEQEHDWCISRQIWWGITIPVYYRANDDASKEPYLIAKTEQEAVAYYGEGGFRAETDTFDTWYSSGQWPFATLLNTEEGDFDTFYPTSLMATAREILHKWVTRMVMFGLYKTGEVPFKQVYLWGIVTDENGQKMSKSKGNVLDPLELTAKYGTDALRLTAALTNTPGNDSPLGEEKVIPQRNFCNKLWNIAKFVEMLDLNDEAVKLKTPADHWIVSRFDERVRTIHSKFKDYRLNEAAYELYHFVWDDLADWYVEASKTAKNPALMRQLLKETLMVAHPFIPFITEEIWQQMFAEDDQLAVQQWSSKLPTPDAKQVVVFNTITEAVRAIRIYKKELGAVKVRYYLEIDEAGESREIVGGLAGVEVVETAQPDQEAISGNVWVQIDESQKELLEGKKTAQKEQLAQSIKQLEGRLSNKGYVDNAPKALVDETKAELESLKKELDAL